ncbi:hypothetical protein HELRODRAFT_92847 [Helobdella robusta]|uniref:Cation-transporting P-type ATPase N-terminal domain-containing protein n=1 Tax=Helobdella robusta TaxID=6412 RepID=T1G8M2_HELRO|nr:hypothetical protein HELRODRAFT_92847 [Helobdella robusta]ESN93189.1 hypothetical protein HELRODRAFT_92847 [Helobdella robusta]
MDDAHSKSAAEVVLYFRTNENTGLSDDQVAEYQEKYGPNGMCVCVCMCVRVYACVRVRVCMCVRVCMYSLHVNPSFHCMLLKNDSYFYLNSSS